MRRDIYQDGPAMINQPVSAERKMDPWTSRCRPLGPAEGVRRGAVAVEFACVAPVLLIVIVGLLEMSRVYSVQNVLETAAREGARFAGLDRSGLMLQNQTANQKLITDVKNYLATNNIDPTAVTVRVVKASNPSQDFNLDDPNNALQLFQVHVEVPYSKVCYSAFRTYDAEKLSAVLTYRNGRAPIDAN
jgi:Flp pilus assembly protein TadG